jgi:hypothetical protein
MDPSKRFVTLILAAGVVVLLLAIAIGERMGDRVLVQAATDASGPAGNTLPVVTPVPQASSAAYGPDWKRSQALTAAPDPRFPDPRVPPVPLPTPLATPKPKPTATPTPDVDLPVMDATASPTPAPEATATPLQLATPAPSPTSSGAFLSLMSPLDLPVTIGTWNSKDRPEP